MPDPEENEVLVRVHSVGLNFRDVLNVLGQYPGDPGLPGGDMAGIVVRIGSDATPFKNGDVVFGVSEGALSTYVLASNDNLFRKPACLSLDEAAASPIIFITAEV